MQRTLVGITGDDRSADALRAAQDVSRRLGADLTYVHAAEHATRVAGWLPAGARERAVDAPLAGLRSQFVGRIRAAVADANDLEDRVVVQSGPAADVLSGCARVRSSELLFLGGQRRAGSVELGATQRRLLESPPCALWFQGGRYFRPRNVSLASAGGLEREALPLASRLAGRLGARFARRIGFETGVHAEELFVLTGGAHVCAQAAELLARGAAFLVVSTAASADDDETPELEPIGFFDPDAGIDFDLG